jgi:hypothetical protein
MSVMGGLGGGRIGSVHAAGLAFIAATGFMAGCLVDSTPAGSSSSSGGYVTPPSASGSSSGPAQPLVVDVDANQTLQATPGQGIGVYVEYETGGHWNVSWTCDTSLTSLSCNFVVDASVTAGTLVNSTGDDLEANDMLTQESTQHLEAATTTTTGIDGIRFDTAPGATLTVGVQLNAPVSFFFVQDGQVNGGYKGVLTNPLMFHPSNP